MATQFFVGIDVSKATLDVCILPTGESFQVSNDTAGIGELLNQLRPLSPERVVMEATGGYETEAAVTLFLARFKVCVVNPLQVRSFGRADGQFAKTDRIDAGVIAKFGERMRPEVRTLADAALRELDALVTRQRQVQQMITSEKNRMGVSAKALRPRIQAHIDWLKQEMESIGSELEVALQKSPVWQAKVALYTTTPGIGEKTAQRLVAQLPELGLLRGKQIAALVGAAPFPRDSGVFKGQRRIRGGRADVRCALYMATVTAKRWNPVIKALYERLRARGKPYKVAMIACLRKLVVILNTMARTNTPWNPALATKA
ncbi:IS110 family transposase [Longimicrobium sp.]|uniref:IS110 family transposase n=1 Tax=Longimicrobium sp. TaxID=2029185 RepID=UPI003B3B9D8B